jgi:hypothetical protein
MDSGLWKYIEAEALDGLDLPTGARAVKACVLVEVEDPSNGSPQRYREIRIHKHLAENRQLRKGELNGLLFNALVDNS